MKIHLLLWSLAMAYAAMCVAQAPVDMSKYSRKNGASVMVSNNLILVSWPVSEKDSGKISVNLEKGRPLLGSIGVTRGGMLHDIVKDVDPAFILTVGRRDLVSQNGWNIFFDMTAFRPYKAYVVNLAKNSASVASIGSRTTISIADVSAGDFKGKLEITVYNGSPLVNIAAVVSTDIDSTAIIYDAGLVSEKFGLQKISWSNTENDLQNTPFNDTTSARNVEVKYRTIVGESEKGSIALFPPPHQYFPPLDNAYNLKFTWHGKDYRNLLPRYGIGIRNELLGDMRYVPWFNAPPQTLQTLAFFSSAERRQRRENYRGGKKIYALGFLQTAAGVLYPGQSFSYRTH
jgi:hypothetical protein